MPAHVERTCAAGSFGKSRRVRSRGAAVDAPKEICQDASMMEMRAFSTWKTEQPLTRQFAVLSFIVIGLITATLSLVTSLYLRKDLLDREWSTTADYIRTQAFQSLTLSDFADPSTKAAQTHFETFYQQTVMMPEIVRVRIYDAAMAVVWSDEPRLIGQRFPDNPHLVSALDGRTTVNIESGKAKEENVYKQNEFAWLVEVYVPIVFPGTGGIAGVVETYKMPRQIFASIRRGQVVVVSTAVVGGMLLYLSLFWIVRRASRRIDEQHLSLENRGRDLARTNEELCAVQTQLLEAERMAAIGEVVAAVAHGIRNPLANIRASAQVASLDCRGAPVPPLTARNLSNIMAEVDRLEGRLRELLQFVRPADRQNVSVDLNALVGETVRMVAGRIAATQITLSQVLASDLLRVLGNAMLLEQVVLSLLVNAIEAIPNGGGTIRIVTGLTQGGKGGPAVFVEVNDSGVGIPPEQIPNLFKPFYTTKAQGTGLGLAIAKKFAEAQGGAIAVSTRPGEGATFRVTFPAYTEV